MSVNIESQFHLISFFNGKNILFTHFRLIVLTFMQKVVKWDELMKVSKSSRSHSSYIIWIQRYNSDHHVYSIFQIMILKKTTSCPVIYERTRGSFLTDLLKLHQKKSSTLSYLNIHTFWDGKHLFLFWFLFLRPLKLNMERYITVWK